MEKCIHPKCACAGYKQPTGAKGTLLILRTGCSDCGHVAAEHRKLTATDVFICDEVRAASSRGCGYQIPVAEVPRSPVFGSHDPIYLPWGDSVQDCSVVCTCTGFVTSNMVTIQQSLYRRTQGEAVEELGKTSCSFCHHPFSSHKGKDSTVSVGLSEVALLSRLRLKSVAKLHKHTSPCFLTLDHTRRQFVFSCLQSSNELAVLTISWDAKKAVESQCISEQSNVEADKMETNESKPTPMETSDTVETTSKASRRSKRKKRSSTSFDGVRRKSSRLEAKKLQSLKISTQDSTEEAKPEVIVPVEATERFVRELKEPANYRKLGELPTVLTDSASLAVLSIGSGLVIAVASQSSSWVSTLRNEGEMVWSTLSHNGEHGNFTCLSMAESSIDFFTVAMGTDRGEVIVWKVGTHQMCISPELMECVYVCDCQTQVTAMKWTPDAKTLGVGCFHGDVLLYLCDNGLRLIQTVRVCGGSVRTLAWSVEGRALAVGGSDDCVQVLVSPPTSIQPTSTHHGYPTIRDFFKPVSSGFQHTLTLKGHQSFVADVHFTRSGLLLTLGWDGQVLIWTPSHHPHPHTEDSDPVGGFKIGPSTSVKFLPLSVTAVDDGLLVLVGDRHSELSLIHYSL